MDITHGSWVGYVCMCALTYVQIRALLRILGSGWMYCSKVYYVVGDPLVKHFTKVNGSGTFARAYSFAVSRPAGRSALKFGVIGGPLAMRFTGIGSGANCTCARENLFFITQ